MRSRAWSTFSMPCRCALMNSLRTFSQNDRLRRELISNIAHRFAHPTGINPGIYRNPVNQSGRLTAAQTRGSIYRLRCARAVWLQTYWRLFELSNSTMGGCSHKLKSFPLAELLSDVVQSYSVEAEKRRSARNGAATGAALEVCADIGPSNAYRKSGSITPTPYAARRAGLGPDGNG